MPYRRRRGNDDDGFEWGECAVEGHAFRYPSHLPEQRICRQHYYENRGDHWGALTERQWSQAFEAGQRSGGDVNRAHDLLARISELVPLDEAIALCHPDRHPSERAEQANRVTAALLELRERLAA